ncbi:MAG: carboxy terminal-processing peptidase, partial [Opitutales bacterium]
MCDQPHPILGFLPRFRLIILTLLSLSSLQAELVQTPEMAAQTRWAVGTVQSQHYLRDQINDLDGKAVIEAYIKSFDYRHMFFNREEIDRFLFRFGSAVEAFLTKGNLYAAFEIYEAYKQQFTQRTEWINQWIERDFTFSSETNYTPDRSESDWPKDTASANQLWQQRIQYELLNELLSLASEAIPASAAATSQKSDIEPTDEEEVDFDPRQLNKLLDDPAFFTETLEAARQKLRRRYQRSLNYVQDREAAEIQESFINAMTQLFDPHSSFLSADTLESFNTAVQNSFVGIGALLQDEDGICTIKELIAGGPAERSNLLSAEDQILAVAQGEDGVFEDVVDMQLRYIVRKIKGKKGSFVRLRIRPGDAADPSVRKDITIQRDEVKLTANLASAQLIEVPNDHGQAVAVGVIDLPSFYGNIGAGNTLTTTTDDVEELIEKLSKAGAEGLILDLRSNGGGLLSEAVRLAGLFIPVGPVVQIHNSAGKVEVLADRNSKLKWDKPIIILTSRFSASASEIVAGALQDHQRALIVGNTSTHGKGTVQEVHYMNSNNRFAWLNQFTQSQTPRSVASKITIKQFYLPSGRSTQVKGVPSDIVLPSANEFLPIGEADLPHALPWNRIEAIEWVNDWPKLGIDAVNEADLVLSLQQKNRQRVEQLEEFDYLKKQIDWRKTQIEQKSVSLNLKQRIRKKIEEQAYVDELDALYEALDEKRYKKQTFQVRIAEIQEANSRKNQERMLIDTDKSEIDSTTADEPEDVYDIYLREASRIMVDWIEWLQAEDSLKVPKLRSLPFETQIIER